MDDNDWIDDILEDKPAEWWQIDKIEMLIGTSSTGSNYTDHTGNLKFNKEDLTYEQANTIIYDLKENDNPRDCRDQFYKIFGRNK
tara:strand:+ start:3146 stop:3400 length:255 start_codon:yes stop_codon:yes gene_type:complete